MRYLEIIKEDITDNPAFMRWFGASKVVDDFGRPLRMYHGTSHNHIRKFEVGYNSWGNKDFEGNHKVISFTTDPNFAARYAGDVNLQYRNRRPTIYPVYIRSINPGDFRNPEHVEKVKQWRRDLWAKWIEGVKVSHPHIWTPEKIAEKRAEEERRYDLHIPHGSWMYWENPALWKVMGWDGAWMREEPHRDTSHVLNFAVADGHQVKSAVGNRGNFDPENAELTEKR